MNTTTRHSLHHLRAASLASLALFALAACQSEELAVQDLGNTSDQLSTEEPEPGATDPLEGRWVGEGQDIFGILPDGTIPPYRFPSGSTQITLEISRNEDGDRAMILTFGEGTLPEPEVGVAHPPGFDAWSASFSSAGLYIPPFEGVAYRLVPRGERLSPADPNTLALGFDRHQPYAGWCAVQPARPQGDGDYDCVGSAGYAGGDPPDDPCINQNPDGSEEPVDCNLLGLCVPVVGPVCECDSRGCEATIASDSPVWLRRRGDELLASIATGFATEEPGLFLPLGLIRLQRVAD